MKILIVDDHALFRTGLGLLLSQLVPYVQVSQASNAAQALAMLTTGNHFDLVLLDWHMPSMPGMDALLAIREALPHGRVVVVSGEQSPAIIRACVDNGAAGFIPKDSSTDQLTAAIRVITDGGIFLPSLAQFAMGQASHGTEAAAQMHSVGEIFPSLTARQSDVLRCMARGLPNKLIARELGITEDTVKQHLSAVYQALAVHNRTEAVYAISQRGIRIA